MNQRQPVTACKIWTAPGNDPSAVGRFGAAIALLNEAGFDRDLILNTDAERFKRFIGADPERNP